MAGASRSDRSSRAVEHYLKAIHDLGGTDQVVSPYDIAEHVGVRGSSVTGMLKRLAALGWVTYEPGRGACLTATGMAHARKIVRRRRLLERFLTDVLGLNENEANREVEVLDHAISPRLEQALAAYLGETDEDVHPFPGP